MHDFKAKNTTVDSHYSTAISSLLIQFSSITV